MGQFNYPYTPSSFTGLNIPKSYYSSKTLNDAKIRTWDVILQDSKIVESWEVMNESFYKQLRELYEANNGGNTYTYQIDEEKTYIVEIVSLTGQKFKKNYYKNVTMILKPFGTL